ncbi:MAG: hypothetical protein ACE37H_18340 [Phycisphaeraceae bacterium]
MSAPRPNPIPLPAAVLALSVAVCIGSAGHVGAAPLVGERATQAEQRETLEHLIDALQQAAKKLADKLAGQSAHAADDALRPQAALIQQAYPCTDATTPAIPLLRDGLLNLPPPTR